MVHITAEELLKRYNMQSHVENGSFSERHYESDGPGRASSGAIYYYVAPDEITKFHVIDCNEYWCYIAGSPLEICMIDLEGNVSFSLLGVEDGCEPLVFVRRGVKFASRHVRAEQEGTFISCITVPRFQADGFMLIEDGEIIAEHPELEGFLR